MYPCIHVHVYMDVYNYVLTGQSPGISLHSSGLTHKGVRRILELESELWPKGIFWVYVGLQKTQGFFWL